MEEFRTPPLPETVRTHDQEARLAKFHPSTCLIEYGTVTRRTPVVTVNLQRAELMRRAGILTDSVILLRHTPRRDAYPFTWETSPHHSHSTNHHIELVR